MKQPIKLLPCPFCGRAVEVMADDNGGSRNHPHPVYWIECRTFICDGLKTGKFTSQSDLAEYWNNRAGGTQ